MFEMPGNDGGRAGFHSGRWDRHDVMNGRLYGSMAGEHNGDNLGINLLGLVQNNNAVDLRKMSIENQDPRVGKPFESIMILNYRLLRRDAVSALRLSGRRPDRAKAP